LAVMTSAATLRVLVVDDETLLRWSIAEVLAHNGHRVVEAASASAARAAIGATSDPIDVVVLDFRLPDSDDLQLLADIRRQSPGSAIVLMTAFGTPEVVDGALALGAYRVVNKPFDMLALDGLLRSAHAARQAG
jgi:DNA-binding NtrC family response regulator